ncbi:unnamed protein product, partial [Cyprideis torosa]
MVEGEMKECQESELIDAIKAGHEAIKVQCQAQLELAQKIGEKATVKREKEVEEENEEVKAYVADFAKDKIYEVAKSALDKMSRKDQLSEIKDSLVETMTEEKGEEYMEENGHFVGTYFDKLKKEVIREMVLSEK